MKAGFPTKETILDGGVEERDFPDFRIGDTVEISLLVKEGEKERLQIFTGYVISMHKKGISSTFTVRKISANNIGVEKILPYYSPKIDGIKILKRGKVRRAKLFYLRDRVGKAARIKEKILTKEQKKALLKTSKTKVAK